MQGSLAEVAGAVDSSMVEVDRRVADIGIDTRSMGLVQLERHYIPCRTYELVDAIPSQRNGERGLHKESSKHDTATVEDPSSNVVGRVCSFHKYTSDE